MTDPSSNWQDTPAGRRKGSQMSQKNQGRVIEGEVTVNAGVEPVWRAWTSNEGAETFFAPRCTIDARPGGKYEMLFDLDAEPGKQGGEGMMVLAIQPRKMLSFTWNAPPQFPDVRGQMTHVMVLFYAPDPAHTMVLLRHDGWGEGDEWDSAYEYFERAWKRVVLPRLKYRFEVGPIDWNKPPDLSQS
jgi:uncharacterized protein YndB with AHSA1/START domain